MLWIGFKFVSLTYQKQCKGCGNMLAICCELVSNLYLWHIRNNAGRRRTRRRYVVNWFQICIFDISETIGTMMGWTALQLWIGFKFVSLTYQKQSANIKKLIETVVNWFQICIFDISETIFCLSVRCVPWLWIGFKFVSLTYQKQYESKLTKCN